MERPPCPEPRTSTADTEPCCTADLSALRDAIAKQQKELEIRTVETFRNMRDMVDRFTSG